MSFQIGKSLAWPHRPGSMCPGNAKAPARRTTTQPDDKTVEQRAGTTAAQPDDKTIEQQGGTTAAQPDDKTIEQRAGTTAAQPGGTTIEQPGGMAPPVERRTSHVAAGPPRRNVGGADPAEAGRSEMHSRVRRWDGPRCRGRGTWSRMWVALGI
ncbi:hypothetical protein [Actinoplanes regularis]|uniref:hypothetical protein n=1 Tax=Actinoplanes regularis TaxID=52697 RepID=UPI00117851D4|nr:hypothetical protein [Actinoplanes regularis]GIE84133.1 hypothetical protein Are01nite_06130 [Actinoplanes regularis]